MKISCQWTEKMKFNISNAEGATVAVDSKPPLGQGSGPTPKELALMGVAGCTAMDVIALMKKHKQPVDAFSVEAETNTTDSYPSVFTKIVLVFKLTGPSIDSAKVLEAVHLSQSKYCGVSAMMVKAAPISYRVELNGAVIGTGRAEFSQEN